MKRTAKRRHARTSRDGRVFAASAMAFLAIVAAQQSRHLWASSETVCVSVTVIGQESVPLGGGEPCDGVAQAEPSSSASSASSVSSAASSAGSAGGIATTNDGTGTVTDGDIGGRRHSIPQSMKRTRELLERWSQRHLRPAASCALPFVDVPLGVWYRQHVLSFFCKQYLDENTFFFRPMQDATRAEMAKLLVRMSGGLSGPPPERRSFDDVDPSAWYYPYVEEAAKRGWMKGYGNCYGTRPCLAKPDRRITRAEAAAMIVRFFSLQPLGTSAPFDDVPSGAWYEEYVRTAADHCILRGDSGTRNVRPDANLNRAEMVTILSRTEHELLTGVVCDPLASIPAAQTLTTQRTGGNGGGTAAQAPASEESPQMAPERCEQLSYSCLAEAVISDSVDLLASILAGSLPSGTAIREASPSELLIWTSMLSIMVAGSFIGSCVVLHRLSARRSHMR